MNGAGWRHLGSELMTWDRIEKAESLRSEKEILVELLTDPLDRRQIETLKAYILGVQ